MQLIICCAPCKEILNCKDGSPIPKNLMGNKEILRKTILEPIRVAQGNISLYIDSAYRTQNYNDRLYKKKGTKSMHILAGAADIHSDIGVHELGVICKRLYDEGIIGGLGLGDDCIHVDARNLIPYVNKKAIWFYDGYEEYEEYEEWSNAFIISGS